jgi:two-component system nitrate/nitrite response regulator NarP
MDKALSAATYSGLAALSQREAQVLAMTSRGLTNMQIAEQLHVTVHAVKFHLASIYRKLGVGNRTEAAAFFLRGGRDAAPDGRDQ